MSPDVCFVLFKPYWDNFCFFLKMTFVHFISCICGFNENLEQKPTAWIICWICGVSRDAAPPPTGWIWQTRRTDYRQQTHKPSVFILKPQTITKQRKVFWFRSRNATSCERHHETVSREKRVWAPRLFVPRREQFLSCGLWENPYWISVVTWAKETGKSAVKGSDWQQVNGTEVSWCSKRVSATTTTTKKHCVKERVK